MSNRQARQRLNSAARPHSTVERLELRVLMSGVPGETPAAPWAAIPAVARVKLAAPLADAAPPAQGQVADEMVPGGVILRSIRPGLPIGAAATGSVTPGTPAPAPPRAGVGGLDIVLKKGPNLAANLQATAAF